MRSYVGRFCGRKEDKERDRTQAEQQPAAAESERNDGDEGFVEDYIDHDHHLEERRELSHPNHLSTSSTDEDDEVCPRSNVHTEAPLWCQHLEDCCSLST